MGSGRITPEEMRGTPHHWIDVAAPNDFFSMRDFQCLACAVIDDILARRRMPFLVGFTGLHVGSVTSGDVPVRPGTQPGVSRPSGDDGCAGALRDARFHAGPIVRPIEGREDAYEMVSVGPTNSMRTDPLAWIGQMNNLRHRAEEIILRDMVCSL